MNRRDPTKIPEWRAISLECKLTRQLCGSGLTSISRANYADGLGEYYSAFFALSIGLERLCKLVVCFDEEQRTQLFPTQNQLSNYGHDLIELYDTVRQVADKSNLSLQYGMPSDPICKAIVQHLSQFASAKTGRYANFSIMNSGSRDTVFEPIHEWQQSIGKAILEKHFRGRSQEDAAKVKAKLMETLLGPFALVRHTAEDGSSLDTLEKAAFRTSENGVLQKYGRYYSFILVRWLSEVFSELTRMRGYEAGGELWFGHYEHFFTFTVPNNFGLTRRVWPLS